VIRGNARHHEACLNIARALPGYFTPTAIDNLRTDLLSNRLFVSTEGERPVGFATLFVKNRRAAELTWLAVSPGHQGEGFGSALVKHAAAQMQKKGVALLEVKTLAATSDYAPYQKTRRFYERLGFFLLETIDPFPGWEPGNPCAIYVKILRNDAPVRRSRP